MAQPTAITRVLRRGFKFHFYNLYKNVTTMTTITLIKKPLWDLLKQEMMGWQWHQLDCIQVICTSLQTDNHANTPTLSFYRLDALPATQTIASMQWKYKVVHTSRPVVAEGPRDVVVPVEILYKCTRSPAIAEGLCEHMVSRNLVKCCTNVRRIALEKVCNR